MAGMTEGAWECVLPGLAISKKNSQRIFRGKLLPCARYMAYHDTAMPLLSSVAPPKPFGGIRSLTLTFWYPDRHVRDLNNSSSGVMDMLTEAGIIQDDCWTQVPELILRAGGISKDNPRTEIRIEFY